MKKNNIDYLIIEKDFLSNEIKRLTKNILFYPKVLL